MRPTAPRGRRAGGRVSQRSLSINRRGSGLATSWQSSIAAVFWQPTIASEEKKMKRSSKRVLTTHTGSLPRPADLIELMRARETGQPYDEAALKERVQAAVVEIVHQQAQAGIDIVSDGAMGKPSFFQYVRN